LTAPAVGAAMAKSTPIMMAASFVMGAEYAELPAKGETQGASPVGRVNNQVRSRRASPGAYAPTAGIMSRDEEEDGAVEHGKLTLVLHREERTCAVREPLGDGHLATREECRPRREEAQHGERARD